MNAKTEIRVGIRELRGNLTRYLQEARQGTSVLVTARGKPVAEIRAVPAETRSPRKLGALKGRIWMAEDFDRWPEDILTTFDAPLEP